MRFSKLLKNASIPSFMLRTDPEIGEIVIDSRKAGHNSLFVCMKGAKTDGHSFASAAYRCGCRAFVVQHLLDLPNDAMQILQIIVYMPFTHSRYIVFL